MPKHTPDTLSDIGNSDLVQLSRDLLEAVVGSTKILNLDEMTPQKLQESKMVLGFLNAADKTMKTKMQYFQMTGLSEKVAQVRSKAKEF